MEQSQPAQSQRDLSPSSLIGNHSEHNSTLIPDVSLSKRATGGIFHQRPAFKTMKVVSQPEDVPLDCIDSKSSYFRRIPCFSIDSGVRDMPYGCSCASEALNASNKLVEAGVS